MIYIVYTYIHTWHKILFCAPLRTKTPKPHGKKEESVKHNYYSKVQKCDTGDMSRTHMLASIHVEWT